MRPDGAHTHGSQGSSWNLVVLLAAVVLLTAAGGVSGVLNGLAELLIWLAVVLAVAVTAAVAYFCRLRRRGWRPDYVRSMHGPSDRDEILDQRAALRREIALTRAARRELEIEVRKNGIAAWHEDVKPVVWAEIAGEDGNR